VLFSNLHRQGYREVKLHVEKKGICLVRLPGAGTYVTHSLLIMLAVASLLVA